MFTVYELSRTDDAEALDNEAFDLHGGEEDVDLGCWHVETANEFIARNGGGDELKDADFVGGEIGAFFQIHRFGVGEAESFKDIGGLGCGCCAELEELMSALARFAKD